MASFDLVYEQMQRDEYSCNPELFLHKHDHEKGYTIGGLYEHANPTAINWGFVKSLLLMCGVEDGEEHQAFRLKRASRMLYGDIVLQEQIKQVFKRNYWDKNRLSEIHSQKIAHEIFDRGVLSGRKVAAKIAQRVLGFEGAEVDGVIGPNTLKALNVYDENAFDKQYDQFEKRFIDEIIESKAKYGVYLERYRNGWTARAERI